MVGRLYVSVQTAADNRDINEISMKIHENIGNIDFEEVCMDRNHLYHSHVIIIDLEVICDRFCGWEGLSTITEGSPLCVSPRWNGLPSAW